MPVTPSAGAEVLTVSCHSFCLYRGFSERTIGILQHASAIRAVKAIDKLMNCEISLKQSSRLLTSGSDRICFRYARFVKLTRRIEDPVQSFSPFFVFSGFDLTEWRMRRSAKKSWTEPWITPFDPLTPPACPLEAGRRGNKPLPRSRIPGPAPGRYTFRVYSR